MIRIAMLSLGLLFSGAAFAAEGRRVAITIDDLPWVEFAHSTPAEASERSARLVGALAKGRSHAIGFVNEGKLVRDGAIDPARVAMLVQWIDAGLDLGNHTYDHPGLHATPIEDYERAILRGEAVLRPLLAEHGRELTWFRHPFLQAGRDDSTRERLDAFLAAHGYRIAPVTVDNGDWIYARAYIDALNAGNSVLAARLLSDSLDYLEAKFAFYELASQRLFGREIVQILLLHANALNADAMPALLERLRRRGYAFVPLAVALADPAYAHADGYRGAAGISWMHRWAMAEDKPPAFYAGEPVVAPYVLRLADVEGE